MSKLRKSSWAVSCRPRRHMAEPVSKYLSSINGLQAVAERFSTVVIENMPAAAIIKKYDKEDVLFYCDPPYVPSTRRKHKTDVFGIEMSLDEHVVFLDVIKNCRGAVIVSGYSSELYANTLQNWERHEIKGRSHISNSGQARTEVLWMKPHVYP